MRRLFVRIGVFMIVALSLLSAVPMRAASAFANPAFQQQWQQGEAMTPNFWGPLATAKDGQQEAYADASGGQRLVQYFDKGRMELTNGIVTNGLLASEIIKGQVQIGDATFQPKTPPGIPIAGDPDNAGPTYAGLSTAGAALFVATAPIPVGSTVTTTVDAGGNMIPGGNSVNSATTIAAFDVATQHNVPGGFAQYRERVGLAAIGYAISEPFLAKVKVAGVGHLVMVQVFERRALTYTAENPDPYKVEMGNIGQHYYQWRYSGAGASPTTATSPVAYPTPPPAQTPISGVAPVFARVAAQATGSQAISLGSATSDAYTEHGIALLLFEHGRMLYLPKLNTFYVLVDPLGPLVVIPRTFGDTGLATTQMPGPRPGTFVPRLGFGKVWQDNPALQQSLGYATGDEQRFSAQAQTFAQGVIVQDTLDNAAFVLNTGAGIWAAIPLT